MVSTRKLLEQGYLPKELPPPFTATTLAHNYSSLPASRRNESLCLRYSYSKYATVRRTVAIPNPAHFIRLAEAVSGNWADILKHCKQSPFSRTTPHLDSVRAVSGTHKFVDIPGVRADVRTGARYIVQADIANFYGSIYTHAIPWAYHTKTVAKKDRRTTPSGFGDPPLFGNVLDAASRSLQSGQTIGLPVGPDTSFIIAESLLSSVDQEVQAKLGKGIVGFRFIDDYEFACASLSEAEAVQSLLQDRLSEYELQLNARKTRILELPDGLDTPWVHELAAFSLESRKKAVLESNLLRYFSCAFELVKRFPGEPVLKYAVRRLSEGDLSSAQGLLQKLLFQSAAVDPGTLQTALYIAWTHQERGGPDAVDREALGRALKSIIERHAPLQHGGDVAWAIWGAVVFECKLERTTVSALESLVDPIAVLMTLFAETKGILAEDVDKSKWNVIVNQDELFDTRWLLIYDGVGKDWLKSEGGDPALEDPFFEAARTKDITFFDAAVALSIPKPSHVGDYD